MSNPFKTGDKVVRLNDTHDGVRPGDIATVEEVTPGGVVLQGGRPGFKHQQVNLRAAVAGQDYQLYTPAGDPPTANSGHLADGSSVQKHSAGPIYPCVITLRDKRLKGVGLFDYGLTSPRNGAALWFSTLEAAYAVADIINKDIAP